MEEDDWLRDEFVELNVVVVADDVQNVMDTVIEDGLVKEEVDLGGCDGRQNGMLDVDLVVQDVVDVSCEDVVVEQ